MRAKLVIKNIGMPDSGKVEQPIFEGDCLMVTDGLIPAPGKAVVAPRAASAPGGLRQFAQQLDEGALFRCA